MDGTGWVYSHIGIESRGDLMNGPRAKFNRYYLWLHEAKWLIMVKKPESGGILSPLLEGDALRSVFRRRKDENEYQKASFDDEKNGCRTIGFFINGPGLMSG